MQNAWHVKCSEEKVSEILLNETVVKRKRDEKIKSEVNAYTQERYLLW